jgi:acyl carrier protein
VSELVRARVAAVLGYADACEVESWRSFQEIGFDSLTALRLRNQLSEATGLPLPATLIFDHPTPASVTELVCAELFGEEAGTHDTGTHDTESGIEDGELKKAIDRIPLASLRRAGLVDTLLRLAETASGADAADVVEPAATAAIDSMDVTDLIRAAYGRD